MALWEDAIPTTLSLSLLRSLSSLYWFLICSISLPPTVPTPQIKRLSTLYSERKKLSCNTFNDLRRKSLFTTKEMLVSEAPCAQAMTEIPLRPSVPNSLPAIPAACFMFSPTMAMVARPYSACIGNMAPSAISFLNSSFNTLTASSTSCSLTPIEVEFSEDAWETMNTEMPSLARAVKIRRLTPMTPTMERPVTVISAVPLIEEIPLIGLESPSILFLMMVPGASGLKVFLTLIGIFLTQTG